MMQRIQRKKKAISGELKVALKKLKRAITLKVWKIKVKNFYRATIKVFKAFRWRR